MRCAKWLTWIQTLSIALVVALFCLPRPVGGAEASSMIATEGVLSHGTWQLHSEMAMHQVQNRGSQADWRFPFVSGVRLGLFDRGEFGVQYGREVSLDGKVQFVQEEFWLPAVSFGARSILASQHAHLYSITDSLRPLHQGEVFAVLGKNLPLHLRIRLGLSAIAGLDSGRVGFFYGIQQTPGFGFALLAEGFQRSGHWHHNAGFAFQHRAVRLAVFATEVQRWIYGNGQLGFSADPQSLSGNALRSPGVHLQIALSSRMLSGNNVSSQARLLQAEEKLAEQRRNLEEVQARLDRLEVLSSEKGGAGLDSIALREEAAERLLNDIVVAFRSDAWDPPLLRRMQDSLVESGEVAHRVLARVALQESSTQAHRLAAVRIMGGSRQDRFVLALSQLLGRQDPFLQREAALALARLGTLHALEALRSHEPKALPELRKTIQELLGAAPAISPAPITVPTASPPTPPTTATIPPSTTTAPAAPPPPLPPVPPTQ